MADSLAFTWTGEAFFPTDRFRAKADEQFAPGAAYWLSVEPERTQKSHGHEFAFVDEAWKTLPDSVAADYPSSEMLRKRALIATGWCTVKDYPCASRAEAMRTGALLRGELDDYAVVIVRADVVRVCRAKSQAKNRMKAAEFQQSKTDVLNWISALLGVRPEALATARAA